MAALHGCIESSSRRLNPLRWELAQKSVKVRALGEWAALGLFVVTTFMAGGCRSQAYQQVYAEKMAGEIRVLEDQLYAAEYENEVLRQQIDRYEQRNQTLRDKVDREDLRSPSGTLRSPRGNGDATQSTRSGAGFNGGYGDDRPDEPGIGSGNRRQLEPPRMNDYDSTESGTPSTDPPPFDAPNFDSPLEIDMGDPIDGSDTGGFNLPPSLDPNNAPPISPVPPRADDLGPPAIDLGEPMPPGGNNGAQPKPPGQIQIPGEVRQLYPGAPSVPASVSIHPGLSGVHHQNSDSEPDGVYLVMTVLDPDGAAFQADKPISVVMLDPARTGEDARLGRWDFTAEQAAAMFRSTPLPSYQMPLLWKDEKRPVGLDVAVFVRVFVDDATKLETDTLMSLGDDPSRAADWVPNAFGTQLASPSFDRETIWR